jgi:DNA-binding transcriptional LysR family regulator
LNAVINASVLHDRVESLIAAKHTCLAGLGLIQIPTYDVRGHVEAGQLAEAMPDHRAEPMPMTLLYPHREHLSRRLQVFADWLEALLKRQLL